MSDTKSIGRSIGAVVAGMVLGAVLSLGTDVVLHALHVFPPWNQPAGDGPLALATVYRIVYSVLGCYVTGRLAPGRPMMHAMVLGAIGVVVSTAGAIATWNRTAEFGPHWYPVALIVVSLPCAWAGGRIAASARRTVEGRAAGA